MSTPHPEIPPAVAPIISAIEADAATAVLVDLLKLASLINGPMRDIVADPLEMSPTELKILLALGGEGELAGHDLSEIMGVPPMNVSRAISGLIQRGWVEPGIDRSNRRRKPVRLSAEGRAAFLRTMAPMKTVADGLLGGLNARDRATFRRAAQSILSRMADWMHEHHAEVQLHG
ncbi:MarR family winged helix-turn-helix transcriptional regulator [Novosphingobium lentum]|uniref:MarR family winged helix-turn-helix transcriptional regulator n=1 Tax=Novosphingobium lentum TaxID=145287 RepID=UPI00082CC55B|nr:MarR family transcriptional regulator [Novosphingobium lentum]